MSEFFRRELEELVGIVLFCVSIPLGFVALGVTCVFDTPADTRIGAVCIAVCSSFFITMGVRMWGGK